MGDVFSRKFERCQRFWSERLEDTIVMEHERLLSLVIKQISSRSILLHIKKFYFNMIFIEVVLYINPYPSTIKGVDSL